MKIALFKNNRTPTLAHYQSAHPGVYGHRAWYRLLVVFASALLIVIGASLFLFYQIINESIFTPDPKAPENVVPINRDKLEKVLERFTDKSTTRAALENEIPDVSDPSVKH